jgi:D-galactarolactone isomerase
LKADCHLHVYDPRFAPAFPDRRLEANATVDDYRRVQEAIGTTRAVIVQPAAYGTDNRVTLDAIQRLGSANTRGIAVVHPDVGDDELGALHAGGIRGLRFSIHSMIRARRPSRPK